MMNEMQIKVNDELGSLHSLMNETGFTLLLS